MMMILSRYVTLYDENRDIGASKETDENSYHRLFLANCQITLSTNILLISSLVDLAALAEALPVGWLVGTPNFSSSFPGVAHIL